MQTVSGEAIPLSRQPVVRLAAVTLRSGVDLRLFLPRRECTPFILLSSLPPYPFAWDAEFLVSPFISVSGAVEVRDKSGAHRLGFVSKEVEGDSSLE
jgi:hypothetical protein